MKFIFKVLLKRQLDFLLTSILVKVPHALSIKDRAKNAVSYEVLRPMVCVQKW